jgi:hypothetical protein
VTHRLESSAVRRRLIPVTLRNGTMKESDGEDYLPHVKQLGLALISEVFNVKSITEASS